MADEFQARTGLRPHVILNLLHRSRLDANRYIDQAAFDDPTARKAYEEFNEFINKSKAAINGRGILFDIHAHIHPEENIELGYLIPGSQLDENVLNASISSVKFLASRLENMSFADFLRGEDSLGAYISAAGYPTVPSPRQPGPRGKRYWYAGTPGTNTQRHGSRDGGKIDAIQIESPEPKLLNVPDVNITKTYARNLGAAIVKFWNKYYPPIEDNDGNPTSLAVSLHSYSLFITLFVLATSFVIFVL